MEWKPVIKHILKHGFEYATALALFAVLLLCIPEAFGRERPLRRQHRLAHYGRNSPIVPGLNLNIGDERTLQYLLNLSEFKKIPSGYTNYYVSTDAGGDWVLGDDDNTGLTTADPLRSLCQVDRLIETLCDIQVIFDSGGGVDVWDDLATEIDCEDGKYWDGSFGPPLVTCGDSVDLPAVIMSASDPEWGVQLDLLDMREEQYQEDCTGANYDNGCDDNNDTVFFGGSGVQGYLAVQNFALTHYPPDQTLASAAQTKSIINGNVHTLNLDAGWLMGDDVFFTNQYGGADVHINPVVRQRPLTDFSAGCVNRGSLLGCADDDDYGAITVLCVGAADPYNMCLTSDTHEQATTLFNVVSGATVLISKEIYRATVHTPATLDDGAVFRVFGGGDLYAIGPMLLVDEIHIDSTQPWMPPDFGGEGNVLFMVSDGDPADDVDTVVFAFTDAGAVWGTAGDAVSPFNMSHDGTINLFTTGTPRDLTLYSVDLEETSFAAITVNPLDTNPAIIDKLSVLCTDYSIVRSSSTSFPVWRQILNVSTAPSLQVTFLDTFIDEDASDFHAFIQFATHVDIAAAITAMALVDGIVCGEAQDATCATGYFPDGEDYLLARQPIGNSTRTHKRPGRCNQTLLITLPIDLGATLEDAAKRVNGWVPGFVGGHKVMQFRFAPDKTGASVD